MQIQVLWKQPFRKNNNQIQFKTSCGRSFLNFRNVNTWLLIDKTIYSINIYFYVSSYILAVPVLGVTYLMTFALDSIIIQRFNLMANTIANLWFKGIQIYNLGLISIELDCIYFGINIYKLLTKIWIHFRQKHFNMTL